MSLIDDLRAYFSKQRRYAAFFEGPSKGIKELGAVHELIKSMQAVGEPTYTSPELAKPDPPDCVALDAAGQRVAIEACELVSREAIQANVKSSVPSYSEWQPADVVKRVGELIRDKDGKVYKGGPYAQIVVLIHTDEPELDYHVYAPVLGRARFGRQNQVGAAFVLFSYDPRLKRCPYVKLSLP